MGKREKTLFYTAGAVSCLLAISGIMGIISAFQAEEKNILAAVLSGCSLVALLYLGAVLFMKKKDILLGTALGANALVELVTVCCWFSWLDLFICLTLIALTVILFIHKKIPENSEKIVALVLSILSSLIAVFAIIGSISHINHTIDNSYIPSFLFDGEKWLFYFMPFVYASLYAVLTNIVALLVNDYELLNDNLKPNLTTFIPLFVILGTSFMTLIIALVGKTFITGLFDSAGEILLVVADIIALCAIAVAPILLLFSDHKRKDEEN